MCGGGCHAMDCGLYVFKVSYFFKETRVARERRVSPAPHLGGQGQGLVALGKFVKMSFFVLRSWFPFIHCQGWVPSFVPYLVHQDLSGCSKSLAESIRRTQKKQPKNQKQTSRVRQGRHRPSHQST